MSKVVLFIVEGERREVEIINSMKRHWCLVLVEDETKANAFAS